MVINTIFVRHFVDPDLGVEIFLEKELTIEKEGFGFKIRNRGTSSHLYRGLKKTHTEYACLFVIFLVTKKE